jgi:hypothetical protein
VILPVTLTTVVGRVALVHVCDGGGMVQLLVTVHVLLAAHVAVTTPE